LGMIDQPFYFPGSEKSIKSEEVRQWCGKCFEIPLVPTIIATDPSKLTFA